MAGYQDLLVRSFQQLRFVADGLGDMSHMDVVHRIGGIDPFALDVVDDEF